MKDVATLVALLLLFPTPAAASATVPDFDFHVSGGGVDIAGRDRTPEGRGTAEDPLSAGERDSFVAYVYVYVPACNGNTPNGGSVDSLCVVARVGCPPGQLRYSTYRSVDVQPRLWQRLGSACLAPGTPGTDGAELVVGFDVEDFRRLPLPPAVSVVQPPGGRVLINIETNVYAQAGPVVIPTEVLGEAVSVRATPVAFAWDFGDGGRVGPTGDPGGPYPSLRNAHVYAVPGEYAVTLTTTYAGEFSVAGGPYLPIDGTAEVVSAAVPVSAHAARTELVAAPLP